MANINITIKNLPQIKAAFNKAPALMSRNLNTAIKKTVIHISGKAAENAPVDTSRLRSSILTGITYGNLKGTIFPNVNYAYYVHEGTGIYVGHKPYYANIPNVGWRYMKGMKPRRFLYDAVESEQIYTDKFFTEAVDLTLNEIGRAT